MIAGLGGSWARFDHLWHLSGVCPFHKELGQIDFNCFFHLSGVGLVYKGLGQMILLCFMVLESCRLTAHVCDQVTHLHVVICECVLHLPLMVKGVAWSGRGVGGGTAQITIIEKRDARSGVE